MSVEKVLKVKKANVPSTVAALNPSDLRSLGIAAGMELEIMTRTRSIHLVAEARSDVEAGAVGLSESNIDKLDVFEGDNVSILVIKAVAAGAEERYEPPP